MYRNIQCLIQCKKLIFIVLFLAPFAYAKHYSLSADSIESQLPIVLATLEDGDSISIPPGNFRFTRALNVVAKKIQIAGAGSRNTVLDFSAQKDGAQAILARGWDIRLKGFSIIAPIGDGLVIRNSARVSLEDIYVDMNRPGGSKNGAYGIYPVRSQHISMRNLKATGASDAGIYLGQSKFAIISNCEAYQNVAGINIENSVHVSVENNHLHHNTTGIFTTSLPDMIYPFSEDLQFKSNVIENNNGKNFSTKGTLMHGITPGIGMLLIATHNAQIAENKFNGNKIQDVLIDDYYYLNRPPHPGTFKPAVGNTRLGNNSIKIPISINKKYEKQLCKETNSIINYTIIEGSELRSLEDECKNKSVSVIKAKEAKVQEPKFNNTIKH